MNTAIDTPTFHLDGAFQTASGLFRLDSGQFPGKDFFPYLGVGVILALYPAFKIFGSDLSASDFSAHFMTLIFSGISISLIWHLVFRPKSIITSFFPTRFARPWQGLAGTHRAKHTLMRNFRVVLVGIWR